MGFSEILAQIQTIWRNRLKPALIYGLEEMAYWAELSQRSALISRELERRGWPPIHYVHQKLHAELATLFQGNDNASDKEIEEIILKHLLESEAGGLASDWKLNPLLEHRIHIAEEALLCHHHDLWYAAIPLWYSQIEGLLMENLAPNKNSEKIRVSVRSCLKLLTKPWIDFPASRAVAAFSEKQAWSYFLDSTESPANSRHGVMHGGSTEYGTSKNSLKAMLLFDYVQGSLRSGVLLQGDFLHAPGCRRLSKHPDDLLYFQNPLLALKFLNYTTIERCSTCEETLENRILPMRIRKLISARYPQLALKMPSNQSVATPSLGE